MNTKIDWNYPQPRPGFAGAIDKFFGPGTTKAEGWLQGVISVGAAVAMVLFALWRDFQWSPLQFVLATWLAFDIVGGIVTNATSSAKRWYHRDGQVFLDHFGFIAFHVVYIMSVSWLFRSMDWLYLIVLSAFLLVSAYVILKVPLYLRRPVAFSVFVIAYLINTYGFPPISGLEWFIPFLVLKLLVSHALREEPYRPQEEI